MYSRMDFLREYPAVIFLTDGLSATGQMEFARLDAPSPTAIWGVCRKDLNPLAAMHAWPSPTQVSEPGMPVKKRHLISQRNSRMKVKRYLQFFHYDPNWTKIRDIIIVETILVLSLTKSIYINSNKTEVYYAALHFFSSCLRILHRQSRKTSQPIGAFHYLICQYVICSLGKSISFCNIVGRLHGR